MQAGLFATLHGHTVCQAGEISRDDLCILFQINGGWMTFQGIRDHLEPLGPAAPEASLACPEFQDYR
jgi:hypothetical protein